MHAFPAQIYRQKNPTQAQINNRNNFSKNPTQTQLHRYKNPTQAQLDHKNKFVAKAVLPRNNHTPAQLKHILSLKNKGNTSSKRREKYAAQWNGMFLEAIEYKKKHGTFEILTNDTENTKLRSWIAIQRRNYINKELSDQRIKSLIGIKFDWGFRWINKLKVKVV